MGSDNTLMNYNKKNLTFIRGLNFGLKSILVLPQYELKNLKYRFGISSDYIVPPPLPPAPAPARKNSKY